MAVSTPGISLEATSELPESVGVSSPGPSSEQVPGVAAGFDGSLDGSGERRNGMPSETAFRAAFDARNGQAAPLSSAEVLTPPARTSSRRQSTGQHPSSSSERPSPPPSHEDHRRPSTSSSSAPSGPHLTFANGSSSDLTKGLPSPPASSALPTPHLTSPSSSSLSTPLHPSSSLRASTASAATSNSSCVPPSSRAFVHVSANPSSSSAALEELDPTAGLIWKLYARLDAQGVPGDGWDEGMERSRDGIINREVAEGLLTVGRGDKGTGPAIEDPEDFEGGELPIKEEQILRRVDRYGFFSRSHPAALACQYHRLATLPAAPFEVLPGTSKRNSKLFSPKPEPVPDRRQKTLQHRSSTASLLSTLTTADKALETKRIDKWARMLTVAVRDSGGNAKEWKVAGSWREGRANGGGKYRKLQRRVFKGVPDRWRRAVWGLEIEKVAEEAQRFGRVRTLEELTREYETLVALPSNQDIQIDLDVPRTISGHVLFHTRYGQGQRALFHVLHAFGLHCEEMGGYCQGMGPIAATFLSYFEPERAYACLVRLFDQYGLRHIFEPGFPGLVEAFYVQEKLVEFLMPDVHVAFTTHGISTSSYATKWYITLFANSVPFGTQLRLWDGLLLEGVDFLVATALAIVWCFREQFAAPNASFESILSVLSSYFLVESDDALLRWIRKFLRRTDLRDKMREWRREWTGFVEDGSAANRVT